MNVLLYYPRLLTALLFRPLPTNHATLCHWVYAHTFLLWNRPWGDPSDTIGMQCVRELKRGDKSINPNDPKTQGAAFLARSAYLYLLFVWPLFALLLSLRHGWRLFTHWNELVDALILHIQRNECYELENHKALTALSLYVPLLYIAGKTGRRWPDRKDEIDAACRQWRLPAPRVFTDADRPLPPGRYFVKPVNGCQGRGIFATTDPSKYIGDPKWVVQEAVRNVPEIRRLWGTDALGTLRFATLLVAGREYEFAGCELRMPVGESCLDNISQGNAFAAVDSTGKLGRVYPKGSSKEGLAYHPTTNMTVEGTTVPRFQECLDLALMAHRRIVPASPFFNADIALTEQGPMIIEYNNAPGFGTHFFKGRDADRFVDSLCRAIARASRQPTLVESVLQAGPV